MSTGPKSTKKDLPQSDSVVEELESRVQELERQVAFVRSELEDRVIERDSWRDHAETARLELDRARKRTEDVERDLATERERAARYGAECHRHEQEELRLRRQLDAAESNLGALVAAKHVVVFSGELGEFTNALVDVVERLKAPIPEEPPAATAREGG